MEQLEREGEALARGEQLPQIEAPRKAAA